MESTVPNGTTGLYDDERGKLFVGGLSWDTSHASLLKYFSRYGAVIDCVVMKNSTTGKSRGFGFVKFQDPAVLDVILLDSPHWLDGRQIDAKVCNPKALNQGGKSAENSRRKIFLGGLPPSCDEAQLREVFRKYGKVEEATIMYDQEKNRSRGFGFLTFETEQCVDNVCNEHFIYINGKQVECKRAEPRQIKSVADMGQSASIPNLVSVLPQSLQVLQGTPGGASQLPGLANGHPQGALSGSPQPLVPSPVGAAMQHPAVPPFMAPAPLFAPAPVPMLQYPGAFPGYYCVPEAMPHSALVRPGLLGVPAGEGAGPAGNPTMQHQPMPLPYGYQAAAEGVSSRPAMCASSSGAENNQGSAPAHISFQPTVTYTLAPGMSPMPGGGLAGPIYGHGDGPNYIQQLPNFGRISTNHGSVISFHPYRRF